MRQYIGARYVPKFMGNYDPTTAYEAISVVDNGQGTSYISKIPTPAGTPLTDTNYWQVYGSSSGAIINLQDQINNMQDGSVVGSLQNQIDTINTNVSAVESLITNKKVLCIGDSYGIPNTEGHGTYDSWIDLLLDKVDGYKIAADGLGFVSLFGATFLAALQADISNITDKEAYTDIIIAGGCNDAGNSATPITASAIESAIQAFVTYAKTQFPNAKIRIACVGAFSTSANLTERALNLADITRFAYANSDADYEYCTFSESVLADHNLIYGVHPTPNGQIELYKYFLRALNGNYSFYRNSTNVITLTQGATQRGIPYTINNNVMQTPTIKSQFDCGQITIGPVYNFGTGVKIGTIDGTSALGIPSRSGYAKWTISCDAFISRTASGSFSALQYAGLAYMYPSEDGKDLMVQITCPDGVGGANNQMTVNLYLMPLATNISI